MQLTSTTDYAIRIVYYLATQKQKISTSELSRELGIPVNYIPKIAKQLKHAEIITTCEGINGGYKIAKQPENLSLRDVISCTESTMAINETEHQEDISFYTKHVYRQLQKNYPEYGITDEDIEIVTHLAPIHDIGKVRVPIEILNKPGKLTKEEMDIVKQHPLVDAEMTKRFPIGLTTEKLNQYSYEICRHHHERYDGTGYPDGLKGNDIPLCAQVVGLVDAYDALISVRPYKKKLEHDQAVQMILNGECGKFSDKLLHCFKIVSSQR